MRIDWIEIALYACILLVALFSGIAGYFTGYYASAQELQEKYDASLEMLNITMHGNIEKGGYLEGIYNSRGFYCVVTKGFSEEEIADTETHEKCHALIKKDPEHFCDEMWNPNKEG